uniref:Uncharacterized protein n=1 Tax=Kalanchoe fedtschenkoi TaxID=63787 RepID=A0A7N1A5F2_KALFE
MSFREDSEDVRELRKPFLHTGSWYRMSTRQMLSASSQAIIRESAVSVVACVMIVALGPIQFGFTVTISSSGCFTWIVLQIVCSFDFFVDNLLRAC